MSPGRPRSPLRTAVLWSYALSGGRLAVTTVLSFVLAAMLGPRSFGLIAMALVFVGLMELLLQQGMLPAIVQRRELTSRHTDTAFWCVVASGAILTLLCLALAPAWAALNSTPELVPVVWALSALVPAQSLVVVHEALLRRALDFKALAVRGGVATIVGGVVGLAAALADWGVWALVAQQLGTAFVGVALLWRVSEWRPGWHFDRAAARELYGYSVRASAASLGLFFGSRADALLAGALFGPLVLGIYRLAHRLTGVALDLGARSMQAVALPALAQLQDERAALSARFLHMQRVSGLLTLPLLGALLGAAGLLAELLGPDWSGVAGVIRGLAVAQVVPALTLICGPTLQALGRPGLLAVLMWARSGLLIGGLLVAGLTWKDSPREDQLLALVVVAALVGALSGMTALWAVMRLTSVTSRQLLRAWLPGATAATAMAAGLSVSLRLLSPQTAGARAAVLVLLVAVIAGAVALATEPQVRRAAVRLLVLRKLPVQRPIRVR